MRRRIVKSIIICFVICAVGSLLIWLFTDFILMEPNMNDELLVPADVVKVPEDQDITVQIYPLFVLPAGFRENYVSEVKLNEIEKGWIINYYTGKCRLAFNREDSSLKDLDFSVDPYLRCFFFAEIIPKDRLKLTDIFKPLIQDKTDPFEAGKPPAFPVYPDSLAISIDQWPFIRKMIIFTIVFNASVILLTAVINVCISKRKNRSKQ